MGSFIDVTEQKRHEEKIEELNKKLEKSLKEEKHTQLLMNEPVHLMDEKNQNGYVLVRSMDNIVGYVKEDDLNTDMSSCEPDLHQFKLVIADMSKRVMSHASSGTLIAEVMMNTVLYVHWQLLPML